MIIFAVMLFDVVDFVVVIVVFDVFVVVVLIMIINICETQLDSSSDVNPTSTAILQEI